MKFEFCIDRGGTFTDIFCCIYSDSNKDSKRELIKVDRYKLLSEDSSYKDSISEGIKRMLEKHLSIEIKDKIPSKYIFSVRIGTTIGTNALLERKGAKAALIMTKGFKDLVKIGNQSRPKIFELNIKKFETLYSESIEINERVEIESVIEKKEKESNVNDNKDNKDIDNSGVFVLQSPDKEEIRNQLLDLKSKNIESLAISLMHSYKYPHHENIVKEIALECGFKYVFMSHESSNTIGYLARSSTCLLDAYLYPVIKTYLDTFIGNFDDKAESFPLYLMQSDGALVSIKEFSGSKSILSGPAGGISGYAYSTVFDNHQENEKNKLIGFDMGGTSTDVSIFEGDFEMNYESEIAGTFISSPHLDINTVAAGGGSCLGFSNSMLKVGPESAGSNPGPVCYNKLNGKLAITDINLLLGRVIPKYFPYIFGQNKDEPLNYDKTKAAFNDLSVDIKSKDSSNSFTDKSIEELAYGYVKVANEVMCRPIRTLTESRGKDPKKFNLAIFGGAGAQHGCSIADNLGINNVFIHKFSSVLSAYGIFLCDIIKGKEILVNKSISSLIQINSSDNNSKICNEFNDLLGKINNTIKDIKNDKDNSNSSSNNTSDYKEEIEISYVLKYEGSEGLITVNRIKNDDIIESNILNSNNHDQTCYDLVSVNKEFLDSHNSMFGFTLENREIMLYNVFIKIKYKRKDISYIEEVIMKDKYIKTSDSYSNTKSNTKSITPKEYVECYFFNNLIDKIEKINTPLYLEEDLLLNSAINGPALIVINGSTIVVENNWICKYNKQGNYELSKIQNINNISYNKTSLSKNAITLSIFGQRFMSIAEQMGRRLQRTALSTNIKERLDFSCAIFGPDGSLVANAPHLPVHLGSMESTVTYQIKTLKDNFKSNDVVISNHPKAGGSHLPDITAITPCFYNNKPIFYVASRGHHADVGGKTPGSMPSFAESIFEEGVSFKSFKIINNGEFKEEELKEALLFPKYESNTNNSNRIKLIGTRNIEENLSDLKAQIASNKQGVNLLLNLVEEYSLETVHSYMKYIQEAAEESVKDSLYELSLFNNLKEKETIVQEDYMDDGSPINLKLTIDRKTKTAIFDFTDSGYEVNNNFNTPEAVVKSSIIYCLRCLVNSDIPLNAGCLKPITIITKEGSLLNPSEEAAIVGGNVTTSQRITDVILKAFKVVADSQGCMNNLTFGNEKFGYYETIAGGSGAGNGFNGVDAVQTHMTNTRITDPEILESRYPVILCKFSIRNLSGGIGLFSGGNGVIREFLFKKELFLSMLSERRTLSPEGLFGGGNGKKGINLLFVNNEINYKKVFSFYNNSNNAIHDEDYKERCLYVGGKFSKQIMPGTRFRVETPGGGAFNKKQKTDEVLNNNKNTQSHVIITSGSINNFNKLQEQA